MDTSISTHLLKSLQRRYATKIFDETRKLSDIDIDTLSEVLRMTPSSFGIQPWKFIIIEDQILREKIRSLAPKQRQVTEASHLIVLCAQKIIDQTDITHHIDTLATARDQDSNEILAKRDEIGKVNRILHHFSDTHASNYEVYIALGFLVSACAMLHIDACPIG
jgi:nitroreductase